MLTNRIIQTWLRFAICMLGVLSVNSLVSQEIAETTRFNDFYLNWKGEKVPVPKPAADGFFRDADKKIRLAKKAKSSFILDLGGIERQKVEQGLLVHNRSIIGKRIKALESKGIEKLYLDSTSDEIVISAVVSDENAGHAILIASMSTLLPLFEDSDVNQAAVVVYLGESWVPIEGQEMASGVVQKKKYGPVVAMSRFQTIPKPVQNAEEQTDASGSSTVREQSKPIPDELNK